MTASSPDPGSVERAAVEVGRELRCPYCGGEIEPDLQYTGHGYSEHRDLVGYDCENYACDARWDKRGHVDTRSKVDPANLLAVPAPAAGGDEVEVVARQLRHELRQPYRDTEPNETIREAAEHILAALAPYRDAEIAAAVERGRRKGLEEAGAWLLEQTSYVAFPDAWTAGFEWAARQMPHVNEPAEDIPAGGAATTRTGEEGPA